MLAVIEQKLAEVRAPQPDARIVFRIESVPLEQLIADLGEVLEELGSEGQLQERELYSSHAVAVDSNNRIFVVEGSHTTRHESTTRISYT